VWIKVLFQCLSWGSVRSHEILFSSLLYILSTYLNSRAQTQITKSSQQTENAAPRIIHEINDAITEMDLALRRCFQGPGQNQSHFTLTVGRSILAPTHDQILVVVKKSADFFYHRVSSMSRGWIYHLTDHNLCPCQAKYTYAHLDLLLLYYLHNI